MRYAQIRDGVVVNLYAGPAPGTIPCDDDRVGPGWAWDGAAWSAPVEPLPLADALAAIDEATAAILARGVEIRGVRWSLTESDRIDWLGLRSMAPALLALAGGSLPVVGADGGRLVLTTIGEIEDLALQLAAYRLVVQQASAHVRGLLHAAETDAERRALVDQYRGGGA